ncbi:MAG: double-strand break repair protein AddB [Alphaproteobacteria bacterium]|nr:double-strand break repair protein AddB [Alphaproteobacteria bacterium]MDX5368846.1 double-strand break repair protein AddB [Alphaproteobacteria bacterium]MDX5463571.1 double-strand break repair protein AddB [Alphaproteobacteria bacterium]
MASGPAVFTIPAGLPFADLVAREVLRAHGDTDPLALADVTLLVPTRRAVGVLREAFLREGGGRLTLLPRLRAIADAGSEAAELPTGADAAALDLAPPVDPVHREILLARLILDGGVVDGLDLDAPRALALGGDLARLIDEMTAEGVGADGLGAVLEASAGPDWQDRLADLSAHWETTHTVLAHVLSAWPEQLHALGLSDVARHRDAMIDALTARVTAGAMPGPVIAAGSTGSVPATRRLLAAVARSPGGAVVLPGLDETLEEETFRALTPDHPQFGLARVLQDFGMVRDDVRRWPGCDGIDTADARARRWLVSEALRPADSTDRWGRLAASAPADGDPLAGLALHRANGPREEAALIAVLMREALETPGRTAALVTPDRMLARRVQAALRRWGIEVDDTGGTPLSKTAPGAFLLHIVEVLAEDASPIALLSLLKHPLAALGLDPAHCRRVARTLDRAVLRGPRPTPGLDALRHIVAGLRRRVAEGDRRAVPGGVHDRDLAAVDDVLARLDAALAPLGKLFASGSAPLPAIARALESAAIAVGTSDREAGGDRLWRGDAGDAAVQLLDRLAGCPDGALGIAGREAGPILRGMMDRIPVRQRATTHPRLKILGAAEARMTTADVLILGGLNEGTWPQVPDADPWLTRGMRSALGLLPPERRLGLAAHDIAQALGAPCVHMTRAEKAGGKPQVASRWLTRLESLVLGLQGEEALHALYRAHDAGPWAAALDDAERVEGPGRPAPKPPVRLRPRRLSVTRIERWIRDPYEIYAQYVLKLSPLDPLDAAPDARDRGTALHAALEAFLEEIGDGPLPADAAARLEAAGRAAFAHLEDFPGAHALWWGKFRRAAAWFLEWEGQRRAQGKVPLALEVRGEMEIEAGLAPFVLTGTADRVDLLPDGTAEILDYKTGSGASASTVASGLSPQLPLEAAMLMAGNLGGLGPREVSALTYVELKGGREPGNEKSALGGKAKKTAAELAAEARTGLAERVARYDDPDVGYLSRLRPQNVSAEGDYDHLARVREWTAGDAGDAEEGE